MFILFKYDCTKEGDCIFFRVSGFAVGEAIFELKNKIISELKTMEGKPFKTMFDLRGLKALDPRGQKHLQELDDYLYECSAVKVGTVSDGLIAKIQHLRVANDSRAKEMFDKGRSKIFTDPNECRAWIKGEKWVSAS